MSVPQNDAVYCYYNNDQNLQRPYNGEYIYTEAGIRFTSYDVGQPGDYPAINDWPHYAVIEHFDEAGNIVWSVTTDTVYCLNGGVRPIGASADVFFYTDYDYIYAIEIASGKPVWSVPNTIGGRDGCFCGKAVGKAGEVYICAANSGKCMVINSRGMVVHADDPSGSYFGPGMVFTDIHYEGDMIIVTARNDEGRINQFMIFRGDL